MRSLRGNIMGLVFALLCLAAQGMQLLPHHHHTDSETPCFVWSHCAAPEEEGCCAHHPGDATSLPGHGGHGHDAPGDECAFTETASAQLRPDHTSTAPIAIAVLPVLTFATVDESLLAASHLTALQDLNTREIPPLESSYAVYAVRALPGRAPAPVC